MAAGDIFVATESFVVDDNGTPVVVHAGATVRDGHSLMRGREIFFARFRVDFEYTPPRK